MKGFTAIIVATLALPLCALKAQDANVVPLPDTQPTGPMAQPSSTPLPLIPESLTPTQNPAYHGVGGGTEPGTSHTTATNPVKKNQTAATEETIADRIKFREAKTKALEDSKIQDQLGLVHAAKKDHEKREAMRKYYEMLYAKILKIDGSIKKLVAQRHMDSLKQLDQSKVRPEEYDPSLATH